jgi:hypothetical protein
MTVDDARARLLDRLANLSSGQFDEVLHKARIPRMYLSGDNPMSRAISAIEYAKQQGTLGELQRLVLRPEVAEALDRYRECKRGAFDAWELRNAGPAATAGDRLNQITLDEMYIPLRFAATPAPARIDRSAEIAPDGLLRPRSRQAIIGAAGSGKTTWMRWTFRSLIQNPGALPFFLELRAIAAAWSEPAHAERPVAHYLIDALAKCGVSDATAVVNELIANPSSLRVVLLVDGWDELDTHGDPLRQRLIEFTASFPHVVVVVSSRPFSASSPSRLESFETRYIQPLSDHDIRLLSQRFHHRVYGADQAAEQRATEEFMAALCDAPDARSLAGTALLLTMMLLLSRQAELPDKRHRLYDACLRTMLVHRVTRRTGTIDGEQYCPPDGMASLQVVAELAYLMQTEDYEISGRTPGIRSWMAAKELIPARWTPEQRDGFLRWLIASAGVLMDRTDNSVHFAHLSFQEHLAAHHMHVTFEGEERREMMRKLMSNRSWWATLRLWAGLIGDDKPEKLTPVFGMLRGQPDGFWLAGQMLADGTGEPSDFDAWCAELPPRLCDPSDTSDACAMVWGACKQSERHAELARRLASARGELNWLDASRHDHWCGLANLDVDLGAALRAVGPPIDTAHAVARSRVLFGVGASWPDGGELAVLRLWPSIRAGVAIRLQSAISLGAGREEVMAVLPALLARARRFWSTRSAAADAQPGEPVAAHQAIPAGNESRASAEHARVEDFVRNLIKESSGALIRQYIHELGREFVRNFIREIVRYASGHFVRDLDQEVARSIARQYGQRFVRRVVREFHKQFERDFIKGFVSHFVKIVIQDYPSEFSEDIATHFSQGFVRVFGRYFGPIVKGELSPEFGRVSLTPGVASWLDSFAFLEASSMVGRAMPRLALACTDFQREQELLWLFHHACKMSFGASFLRKEVDRACEAFVDEPLWPALARHVARMSTPEDRMLLEELVAHPERCKPPLSWGLQYYVRGDLVFNDESVVSLDELCRQCGVTPPRFLEDMPAELNISLDWVFRGDGAADGVRDGRPPESTPGDPGTGTGGPPPLPPPPSDGAAPP